MTDVCLWALGGLPLSPPINSPDSIANIKGISTLSDYEVNRICLGGAKKRAIGYKLRSAQNVTLEVLKVLKYYNF